MAGGLSLGSVDLMGGLGLNLHALGTDSGTAWGNAVPITEQLQTFLQYGSIVASNGWENREAVVVVQVRGNTAMMEASESALFAEVGKPNLLTYTPPGPGAAATVFRVIYSSFENTPDDLRETLSGMRVYTIRLICEPFAFSAVLTNVAALAASGSTTTSVDTGSSTTGWTAKVNGSAVSPSTSGGAVVATSGSALAGTATVAMTRTGAITTSSTKYLVIDWKTGNGVIAQPLTATADGVGLNAVANGASPTAGYTRTTFLVSAASVAVLVLASQTTAGVLGTAVRSLSIDNIDRSDVRPGSAKQQLRTLAITGSAPTTGSLAVQHSTTALGDVLVYTCPDDGTGYQPACRAFRVSGVGAPTSDAAAVSGVFDTLDPTTPVVFDVPSLGLPNGEYLVMARLAGTDVGNTTLTWTYKPRVNATDLAPAISATRNIAVTTGYAFVPLGMVHLPSIDMNPNSTAVMRFAVTAARYGGISGSGNAVTLDELYLLNVATGRLTMVACGTGSAAAGGPANRLWIDSPSLDNAGLGRYLMGFSADRSDAYSAYPSAQAIGIHEFAPGSLKVFTVTTNPTTAADVSFAYYAAWSNHAAS